MPSGRSYKHIDWQALRELIAKGASLKQLSVTFDIPYRTLCARSYRERWNVAAIRYHLPPKSRAEKERKDLREDAHLTALRNGVTLPLVKLASYYQSADVESLRKDSTRFFSFVNAALKVLTLNDGKQPESAPALNLTLLATRPAELVVRAAREVPTVTVPDTQSGSGATQAAEPEVLPRDPVSE